MNPHFKNLNKIEFVVTYACTGKCKHCSEGDHDGCGEHIDAKVAADAVKHIAGKYNIKTVMAFGGEPLLYADTVCSIMRAALEAGVPKRQVITNGYFTKTVDRVKEVAEHLAKSGVNDLLLSADAFHQESIPLDAVKLFAMEAKKADLPIRVQPAWLVSRDDINPYNIKTREIVRELCTLGIEENEGNIIFPEGNALKYLSEYFEDRVVENPYVENPADVKCISLEPCGSVLGENVYKKDIMKIIEDYKLDRM